MKLKTFVNRLLLGYGILGAGTTIFGGFIGSTFFVLLGLSIAIIGLVMSQTAMTRQLIYNLKKNNLWDDEVPKTIKKAKDEAVQP
jgi:hypothetical protein